ncbi:MAG: metal-dependent phosphohydrolase [Thermoanaerobacterales bacterium]|nr:metal-dependent phosphohydrolase [Bacillota bacterium]MDI6906092.1 metal-dependent phosphohydrolase [Thermoanaerobacterales bacterium]
MLSSAMQPNLALARLFFPDRTLEERLRSIPEYTDEYQPHTGEIVITGVIADGCYQHVVNCLHLLADLDQQGIPALVGVKRKSLVETLVFHDMGKIQPRLAVEDRVRPADVFEDGRRHAARSAAFAARDYRISDTVATLIRYHHHEEEELPATFPAQLKPAYRLVRLVDGLSAAITRRGACVRLEVRGYEIIVCEKNGHPGYDGCRVVDLLSGIVRAAEGKRGKEGR